MSRFLAEWGVRASSDRVLEPSAGEASFLLAAGERLRALAGSGALNKGQLQGVELHAHSAHRAEELLDEAGLVGTVAVGDFFDESPQPMFDVVIGNPPYVRYQGFAGEARVKALRAALAQGVRLNGLSSSWAPFTVHAAQFLKRDGRLGLVLPAELLTVKYAAAVRRFLLERFRSVRLVLFEERVFPGVLEEVVLLLAEGEGPASCFEVFQARDLAALLSRGTSTEALPWSWYSPEQGSKWMDALLEPEALTAYRALQRDGSFVTLSDWATTYLGAVTGNNEFFALTRDDVVRHEVPDGEFVRISPPGSRHIRGLAFTDDDWACLMDAGAAGYLFSPRVHRPSAAAKRYIAAGQEAGVDFAYKCRVRAPWWRVPLVRQPDLLLTYMANDRPRLVANMAGVHVLNSLYGVALHAEYAGMDRELLALVSLNSVTLLGAELVGRAYGGGLLKLEPREADQLPMPSEGIVAGCEGALRSIKSRVEQALGANDPETATALVDAVLLQSALGLSDESIAAVRAGRSFLLSRRRTRQKGANTIVSAAD